MLGRGCQCLSHSEIMPRNLCRVRVLDRDIFARLWILTYVAVKELTELLLQSSESEMLTS